MKCTGFGSPGRNESAAQHPLNGCRRFQKALGEAHCPGPLCQTVDPMFSTARTQESTRRCEPELALLSDARLDELTGRSCGSEMRLRLLLTECKLSRVLRPTSPPRLSESGSTRRSASPSHESLRPLTIRCERRLCHFFNLHIEHLCRARVLVEHPADLAFDLHGISRLFFAACLHASQRFFDLLFGTLRDALFLL